MATYAYRWADGSVSVLSARNKDEAALLFDQIAPISRKLILRLSSPLVLTIRPDIDSEWLMDTENNLDAEISLELQRKCFPQFYKVYWDVMHKLEGKNESPRQHPGLQKKMAVALERDIRRTKKRIDKTPQTPHIVVLYPRGLPGQNN